MIVLWALRINRILNTGLQRELKSPMYLIIILLENNQSKIEGKTWELAKGINTHWKEKSTTNLQWLIVATCL